MTAAMALVSVTRFRLRSVRFLPFFMLHANRSIAQIRKANGFVAGAVRRDSDQAFWTITLWRDAHAMRAYGASGAHRKAAPLLAEWADEASVTHWLQAGSALPDWPEAARRLREEGRALALRHPRRSGTEERATEPRTLNAMQL